MRNSSPALLGSVRPGASQVENISLFIYKSRIGIVYSIQIVESEFPDLPSRTNLGLLVGTIRSNQHRPSPSLPFSFAFNFLCKPSARERRKKDDLAAGNGNYGTARAKPVVEAKRLSVNLTIHTDQSMPIDRSVDRLDPWLIWTGHWSKSSKRGDLRRANVARSMQILGLLSLIRIIFQD